MDMFWFTVGVAIFVIVTWIVLGGPGSGRGGRGGSSSCGGDWGGDD